MVVLYSSIPEEENPFSYVEPISLHKCLFHRPFG